MSDGHEDTRDEQMLEFSRSIHELPASLKPPAKFTRKWEKLLNWHEEKELASLLNDTGRPKSTHRLIKRSWAVLDRERNAYDYLDKAPTDDRHPIPIVRVFCYGTWDLSPSLRAAVVGHPIYRSLEATLPAADPENDLIHFIRWAKSLNASDKEDENLLASLAYQCDAMLYGVDTLVPTNDGWIWTARREKDFWILLKTMFDFGARHAYWRTYRDGTLEKSSRRGMLMIEKGKSEWRRFIEKFIVDHYHETGEWLSPAKLRKKLGAPGVAPTSRLRFSAPHLLKMPEIKWSEFQSLAKKSLAEQKSRFL